MCNAHLFRIFAELIFAESIILLDMDKEKASRRIEELTMEIEAHNRNYYVLNSPVISDYDFDMLLKELQDLENEYPELRRKDSPTQHVGSDTDGVAEGHFRRMEHRFPMLSLSNTYSREELYQFDGRIRKILGDGREFSYICELKFDGTAMSLHYVDGRLVSAITRGDGEKGDDVLDNVLVIDGVAEDISSALENENAEGLKDMEIRGEIYMPYDAFRRLNEEKEDIGDMPFANPRNAAAGSLKLQDPEAVRNRGLRITLYELASSGESFPTHEENLAFLKKAGLPVSEHYRRCADISEVMEFIDMWDSERKKLPYATDGIVIKINENGIRKELGFTAKSPRWATAYKFQAERALTRLISIDYQVGRTGAITPVANLEPVQLSGTVVKRASLHNMDQIQALGIMIGDSVYVEKGGEIIPKITGVEKSLRTEDAHTPEFPSLCPDCGSPLERNEGEARHFCPNSNGCPKQIRGRFEHFISRKAMNIKAGESTVKQLFDKGYIRKLSDLYSLTSEMLMTLDSWKEKSVSNFLASIEKSKGRPFRNVLFALGIRHVGETTARLLASVFGNIDRIAGASREELLSVDEIGETIADSIISYFDNVGNLEVIRELKEAGLCFSEDKKKTLKKEGPLAGMNIVISGNFSVSRERMKELIEENGGHNQSSVSSRTDLFIDGEKSGPAKLAKVSALGIRRIDENIFNQIIKKHEQQ